MQCYIGTLVHGCLHFQGEFHIGDFALVFFIQEQLLIHGHRERGEWRAARRCPGPGQPARSGQQAQCTDTQAGS